ncbi:MAG TPA: DUF3656 domain-containing protein, partial [Burkholderiales bacterium]|nr:DUF3656 domain-containing protein [Burkholderiales bacterium]
DGLSFMKKREAMGTRINRVEKNGSVWRVHPNDMAGLKTGLDLYRNRDHAWEQALSRPSAERKMEIRMKLEETPEGLRLTLTDEDGCIAVSEMKLEFEQAKSDTDFRGNLSRLGNTPFVAKEIVVGLERPWFVQASVLNAMRREAVEALEQARLAAMPKGRRKEPVHPPASYPEDSLSYLANVYNARARAFYEKHGVKLIDAAYEAHEEKGEVSLMITKHCLRFSFNLCPKQARGIQGVQGQVRAEPMILANGDDKLTLKFDCRACEMHVVGRIRKGILNSQPPSGAPVKFCK